MQDKVGGGLHKHVNFHLETVTQLEPAFCFTPLPHFLLFSLCIFIHHSPLVFCVHFFGAKTTDCKATCAVASTKSQAKETFYFSLFLSFYVGVFHLYIPPCSCFHFFTFVFTFHTNVLLLHTNTVTYIKNM